MAAQQTQSTALSTFTFPATGAAVRVVEIAGEPWFVATDVCRAMGYPDKSHGWVLGKLGSDESTLHRIQGLRTDRRVVSESGLYKLVMRSDKETARPFQDWVTRDVLPAIRRTGVYVKGEEKIAQATNLDDLDAEGHGKPIRSLHNSVVAWLS